MSEEKILKNELEDLKQKICVLEQKKSIKKIFNKMKKSKIISASLEDAEYDEKENCILLNGGEVVLKYKKPTEKKTYKLITGEDKKKKRNERKKIMFEKKELNNKVVKASCNGYNPEISLEKIKEVLSITEDLTEEELLEFAVIEYLDRWNTTSKNTFFDSMENIILCEFILASKKCNTNEAVKAVKNTVRLTINKFLANSLIDHNHEKFLLCNKENKDLSHSAAILYINNNIQKLIKQCDIALLDNIYSLIADSTGKELLGDFLILEKLNMMKKCKIKKSGLKYIPWKAKRLAKKFIFCVHYDIQKDNKVFLFVPKKNYGFQTTLSFVQEYCENCA